MAWRQRHEMIGWLGRPRQREIAVVLLMAAGFLHGWAAVFCEAAIPDMNLRWADFQERRFSEKVLDLYPYPECFKRACAAYSLPPVLLLAVAKGESDFNPRAVSSANCHGIMQIKWPVTARELGFENLSELYDPCRNIVAGAHYLRRMLDMHGGNIHLALAAYNHGPGRISAGLSPGEVPEKAIWYSGYIYHHAETIMSSVRDLESGRVPGRYRPSNKLPIIAFNWAFRAEGFIAHVNNVDPSIRLEWFRAPDDTYSVAALYSTEKEKRSVIQRLDKIGYKVDPKKWFQ